MNSLPLSPVVICDASLQCTWENRYFQVLRNTVGLNSYLGLSFSRSAKNFGLHEH